ncbi:MAG: hypothetical protein HC868_10025 [Sphingomonadales bacterium]|nr:hypothetical protein [Sphingomonadales bacterium]
MFSEAHCRASRIQYAFTKLITYQARTNEVNAVMQRDVTHATRLRALGAQPSGERLK